MAKPTEKAQQRVIAILDKAFAWRTVRDAKGDVPSGSRFAVKATVEIDGVMSRGETKTSAPDPRPLYEALVVEMSAYIDNPTLRKCRRNAVKHAKAAKRDGMGAAKYLAERYEGARSLIAAVKSDAAEHLPAKASDGSITFDGKAVVASASVKKS